MLIAATAQAFSPFSCSKARRAAWPVLPVGCTGIIVEQRWRQGHNSPILHLGIDRRDLSETPAKVDTSSRTKPAPTIDTIRNCITSPSQSDLRDRAEHPQRSEKRRIRDSLLKTDSEDNGPENKCIDQGRALRLSVVV